MTDVLASPETTTHETAPGGFFVGIETSEPRRVTTPPPSPDEVAAANRRVNEIIAEDDFAGRRGRGCDDVVHGRDTADAEFYKAFEGLLAVANSACDPPRPHVDAGIVVQSVIEVK